MLMWECVNVGVWECGDVGHWECLNGLTSTEDLLINGYKLVNSNMMKRTTHYDLLQKEWEVMDQRIGQMPGFSDAQLEELCARASQMPPVALPALPSGHRRVAEWGSVGAVMLSAVASLLLVILPLPDACAMNLHANHTHCEEAIINICEHA